MAPGLARPSDILGRFIDLVSDRVEQSGSCVGVSVGPEDNFRTK